MLSNYLAHINPENLDKKLLRNIFDDSLMNTQTRNKHDMGKTVTDTLGFIDMWDQRVLSRDEFQQNLKALFGHEKIQEIKTISCLYVLDKHEFN